ncbi:hypothetical protein ACHAXN_009295 [Cyclotella atomus]
MASTFSLGLQRAPSPSKTTKNKSSQRGESDRPHAFKRNAKQKTPAISSDRDRRESAEWLSTQQIRTDECIFDLGQMYKSKPTKPSKPVRSYLRSDPKQQEERSEFDFSSSDSEYSGKQRTTGITIGLGGSNGLQSKSAKKQDKRKLNSVMKRHASHNCHVNNDGDSSDDNDDVQLLKVKSSSRKRAVDEKSRTKQNNPARQSNSQSSSSDESSSQDEIVKPKPSEKIAPADVHRGIRKSRESHSIQNSSSSESSTSEVEVVKVKQTTKPNPICKLKSKLKSRKSYDRQVHSDLKVARSRADKLKIPDQITSPSQLRWHKVRKPNKGTFELIIRPCRVLTLGEASKVKKRYSLSPKEGEIVVQFISVSNASEGKFVSVNDTTLFPFCNNDSTAVDKTELDLYVRQQTSRVTSSVDVETEKLFLLRMFDHVRRVEADSKARAKKDLDDYHGDSCSCSQLHDTPQDEELEIPRRMFEDESVGGHDGSNDEALEVPKPMFEEEEEEPVDEEFFDCPYTQAMNFDPDSNNLDDEVSNEPMRSGDVIEYYSPMFVVGDKRGLRQATVLAVSPDADVILNLSNGECLPEDTRVKRIKVMDGDELFDHPGIYRPIETFKLIAGKVKGGASGIMNEAARFGDIFRKNLSKMQEKAEADGFAPMDMFRTMPGGRNDCNREPSQKKGSLAVQRARDSRSPSSASSDSSVGETPKRNGSFSTGLNQRSTTSKPSPRSLKRALDASDQPRRRTPQASNLSSSSSSSSDDSDGQTLNEIARKKRASQQIVDKENISNSCEETRQTTDHTNSPASLGSSLRSSSPSLGASLATSPSSSERSAASSPSKYRKVVSSSNIASSAINLSAELSSESSSDESSKKIFKRTPCSSPRRNPLSEDDISDSDDDKLLRNKRNSSAVSTQRTRRLQTTPQSNDWAKNGSGWVKSGSSSLPFGRYK